MRLEIFGWTITAQRSHNKDAEADSIRTGFEARFIDKIEAVKRVRYLFAGTDDMRGSLKGALYFIERRPL